MLMQQNEHTGELGIIFWSALLLLSWTYFAPMGFLLFVPLTSSILGLASTNDINWVSVLYFPDQGDLSYVFSG